MEATKGNNFSVLNFDIIKTIVESDKMIGKIYNLYPSSNRGKFSERIIPKANKRKIRNNGTRLIVLIILLFAGVKINRIRMQ